EYAKNKELANKIAKFKGSHKKPARKPEEDDPDFESPSSPDKSSSSKPEKEEDVTKPPIKVSQNTIVGPVISETNSFNKTFPTELLNGIIGTAVHES
ncbi:hypothetical protein ILUMI_16824, partial [Ignelater luminosus]